MYAFAEREDIVDAPVFKVVHDRKPEFGPFIGGDPQAKNLAFALWRDTQGHINGLVFNLTAFCVADFDPQGVEENDGIHRKRCAQRVPIST